MESETSSVAKVRCAYRARSGQCINSFAARGPKKYCCRGHQVRAYQKRTGKGHKRDPLREAAISRDGGCVRRLRSEQVIDEDEMLQRMGGVELDAYIRARCRGKLMVRIVDPAKPRTLENVETLCGRHFGMVSDERFRKRIGPERYRATKKAQARQYHRLIAMRRKMVRIHKGPPKDLLDYIDYI